MRERESMLGSGLKGRAVFILTLQIHNIIRSSLSSSKIPLLVVDSKLLPNYKLIDVRQSVAVETAAYAYCTYSCITVCILYIQCTCTCIRFPTPSGGTDCMVYVYVRIKINREKQ